MIVRSRFTPAPWLRGPHRQTLFAAKLRPSPPISVERERLELPDGDFLDLAWLPAPHAGDDAPLVVVLHGLTGSIESKYARGLLRRVQARGWRGVLMHFRGAGEQPNRLARGYHSGDTGDFGFVLDLLRKRYPAAAMAAVGYSLGGNVLLKYLGERKSETPLSAATAVSVPFDLAICAESINRGLGRAYQRHLIDSMRAALERKFSDVEPPFPLPDLAGLTDFRTFDDAITAPLHGFEDVDDYYTRASSRPFLRHIEVPTLVLHSADDPFMAPEVIPRADELSRAVRLELSEHGGHVGFVAADRWLRPVFWLERRIPAFLEELLPCEEPLPEEQPA